MTPRATIKDFKKEEVEKLTELINSGTSCVFIDVSSMDIKLQNGLKAKIKQVSGKVVVAKNTLLSLASKNAKLPEESYEDKVLFGQTALVVSTDDPIAPIQQIGGFIKENEKPSFKAGVVDGKFVSKDDLVKISSLPGKEVLYGNLVGGMISPLYGLVSTLNGNMVKLLYILEQRKVTFKN